MSVVLEFLPSILQILFCALLSMPLTVLVSAVPSPWNLDRLDRLRLKPQISTVQYFEQRWLLIVGLLSFAFTTSLVWLLGGDAGRVSGSALPFVAVLSLLLAGFCSSFISYPRLRATADFLRACGMVEREHFNKPFIEAFAAPSKDKQPETYAELFKAKFKNTKRNEFDPVYICPDDRVVDISNKRGRFKANAGVLFYVCFVPGFLCFLVLWGWAITSGTDSVNAGNRVETFSSASKFAWTMVVSPPKKDVCNGKETHPPIMLAPEFEERACSIINDFFLYAPLRFMFFFTLITAIFKWVGSMLQTRFTLKIDRQSELGLETDAVHGLGSGAVYFLAFMLALTAMGADLGDLGLLTGLAAAGLSVALRDTLGNFMSGVQLVWDKSLKKGDVISVPRGDSSDTGSTYGIVERVQMRYTVVQDRNTVRRLIPNHLLTNSPIESWTHNDNRVRLSIQIGVGYGASPARAKEIMEAVCYDVARIMTEHPPQALLISFADSAMLFSLRFWLKDTKSGIRPVISEVLFALKERFDAENIEIPFPKRHVYITRRNEKPDGGSPEDSPPEGRSAGKSTESPPPEDGPAGQTVSGIKTAQAYVEHEGRKVEA